MTPQEYQEQLLRLLDEADRQFHGELPFIENQVYKRIQLLIKDLEIKNGVILNNTANLKTIGKIKAEIDNAVMTPKYVKAVQEYVNVFNKIAELQQKYFKTNFDEKLTPAARLDELQKQAKDAVNAKLTGAGIEANVVEQVQDILRRNITTGGSFNDLNFQMQEFLTTGVGYPGKLSAYAGTITTDALNQFSAQYHELISADLGLKWRMYVGSNIATTREWCEWMTKKKYVHVSEIPMVLTGMIDGHQVKMNPKTDLWYGAIAGTNKDNLQINRGGHKCGHQFITVAETVVPKDIRENLGAYQSDFFDNKKNTVNITKAQLRNLSDLKTSAEQLMKLGGGWPVTKNVKSNTTVKDLGADEFRVETRGDGYISKVIVDYVYKKIYNDYINTDKNLINDSGIGFRFLINQIKAARKQGFEKIEIHAVTNADLQGAHTWGKYGVKMNAAYQKQFEDLMVKHSRTEKNIFELQFTAEGRKFWDTHGFDSWKGSFDLRDDSESMQDLLRYIEMKGYKIEL